MEYHKMYGEYIKKGNQDIKTYFHLCEKFFYFCAGYNTLKYELNVYKDVSLFIEQDGVNFWKKIYVKFEHSKKSFHYTCNLVS